MKHYFTDPFDLDLPKRSKTTITYRLLHPQSDDDEEVASSDDEYVYLVYHVSARK